MKHPDESFALAALFDCWTPKWKVINVAGFAPSMDKALNTFGYKSGPSPSIIIKPPTTERLQSDLLAGDYSEAAALLTPRQLYSPAFLYLFRRYVPTHIILAAKSCLWWAVWGQISLLHPSFHISTAEFIPERR